MVAVSPFNANRDKRGRNPYNNLLPRIALQHSAFDVVRAMQSREARTDPAYAFAILKAYCDLKYARGKTKHDIREKIALLEHDLRWRDPAYERCFDEIREFYTLGPSAAGNPAARVSSYGSYPGAAALSGPLARAQTNASSRTNASQSLRTASQSTRRPSTASTRPAVVRASDDPNDEPPPPPYSSQDPEPEATAVLMAVNNAGTADVSSIFQHRRTQSDAGSAVSGLLAGDVPRTNDFPASPAQRMGNLSVPNGTGSVASGRTTGSSSSSPPVDRPPSPRARPITPLNPQEERIREESELEEAMRLSRQSEKERLEYERAVAASLAALEEDTALRSIAEDESAEAGPSFRPGEDRRASSYHPSAAGPSNVHMQMQRAASSSHPGRNGELLGYNGSSSSDGPSTAQPLRQDLMDELEGLNMNDVPLLTPTSPTRQFSGFTPIPTPSPVRKQTTGTFQSKNPFLSEAERQLLDDSSSSPSLPERDLPPLPPTEDEYGTYTPPGGGYTHTPADSEYTPPDGPPPGWLPPVPPPPPQMHEYVSSDSPPVPPPPDRMPSQSSPVVSPSTGLRHVPSISTSGGIVGGSSFTSPAPMMSDYYSPAIQRAPSPAPILIGGENALEMLREYDTVFLIDDSTSMNGERWEQAMSAIMGVVVQAVKYDEDGIDVYFLNSKRVGKGLRTSDDVVELFAGLEPKGATPTGLRLEGILREYMSRLERSTADTETGNGSAEAVRSMNLIVVTDGAFAVPVIRRLRIAACNDDRLEMLASAPTDDPESVLISIAKRLDRGDYPLSQVGVQLLQIGDDAEATEALQELDEGLSSAHGVRDMVDTVPYNGEAMSATLIVKVLLGGINRRIDRKFST